jgi:hypothetical protein
MERRRKKRKKHRKETPSRSSRLNGCTCSRRRCQRRRCTPPPPPVAPACYRCRLRRRARPLPPRCNVPCEPSSQSRRYFTLANSPACTVGGGTLGDSTASWRRRNLGRTAIEKSAEMANHSLFFLTRFLLRVGWGSNGSSCGGGGRRRGKGSGGLRVRSVRVRLGEVEPAERAGGRNLEEPLLR